MEASCRFVRLASQHRSGNWQAHCRSRASWTRGSLLLGIKVASQSRNDQLVGGPHCWSFLDEWLVSSNILSLIVGLVILSRASWSAAIGGSCDGPGSCRSHISSRHIKCPSLQSSESSMSLLFLSKGSSQFNGLGDQTKPSIIQMFVGYPGGTLPTILTFQSSEKEGR